MLIRALIVLLVVLNLGVAAWWFARPAPPPPPLPELPAGIPRLQLVDAPEAAVAPEAPVAVAVAVAEPAACFSLGPFASESALKQAQAALAGKALRMQAREIPGASSGGYQVVMPPAPTREDAQALAARIGAAGFDDFLVISQGELVNGIALGRYRTREAAERRLAQMQAAGFAARMQPVGRSAPSQWWLDAGVAAGADAEALARAASAGAPVPLECAALR